MVLDSVGELSTTDLVARLLAVTRLSVTVQQASDEHDMLLALDRGLWELGLTSFVGRLSDDRRSLRIVAAVAPEEASAGSRGLVPELTIQLEAVPLLGRVVLGQDTVFITDVLTELKSVLPITARNDAERLAMLRGFGRAFCLPLLTSAQSSGLLIVLGATLQSEDEPALRLLAAHLSVALDHAATARELRAALTRAQAVADELRDFQRLATGSAAESSPAADLERLTQAAADAAGVARLALYGPTADADESSVLASVGLSHELGELLRARALGESGVTPVSPSPSSGPIVVEDVRADPGWEPYRDLADRAGIRSGWSVPLHAPDGGQRLGALVIFSDRTGQPASQQLEVLDRYAQQIATVLAVGRSRRRETQDARVEAIAALARTIPHRLAQPLALVSGYAEMIAEGLLEGEQLKDACAKVVEATHEMADLVQRLDQVTSYSATELAPGITVLEL